MANFKKIIQPFVTGIFLLIWANNVFYIFGETLKNIILFSGFLLVLYSVFDKKLTKDEIKFFFITFCFYFLYLFIAWIQDQNTLSQLNLTFGAICFVLLNVGYRISQKKEFDISVNGILIICYSLLSIYGSYAFLQQQVAVFNLEGATRSLGAGVDALNPIGVAYTHSLLFLFLFWLLSQTKKVIYRGIISVAMSAVIVVIISTLSRGAVLALGVFLFLFFIKGIKLNPKILIRRTGLIVFISFSFLFVFLALKEVPAIQSKFSSYGDRFSSLFNVFSDSGSDSSVMIRKDIYIDFFSNIENFIIGQDGYTPYPHNQFLEIFMRWGIFGLPFLIFSIWVFFRSFMLLNKERLERYPLLFLVLALFFFSYMQSMSSLTLEVNRTLWLGFGYLWGFKKEKFYM